MDPDTRHPLERAATGALEKAEKMGGHAAAHWNPDTEDWSVHSATDPNTVYRVWRKHPDGPATEQSEKQAQSNRGWWWFTLECNCPAIVSSGYAVCKHKAAVRLWQLHYQRRDGRAWGTLPAHSNAIARANETIDPDGIEATHEGGAEGGLAVALARTHQEDRGCACWPGPVNCSKGRRCPCDICWHERSGDLFDGGGNPW